MSARVLSIAALAVALAATPSLGTAQDHDHGAPDGALGAVHFATSCAADVTGVSARRASVSCSVETARPRSRAAIAC